MTSSRLRPTRRLVVPTVAAALALTLSACGGSDKSADSGPDGQDTVGGVKLAAVWPLTGLPATGDGPSHPVLAVKIPNTAQAVPQVGLSQADLVYEELVEGGITRLGALYYTKVPSEVGPVRSMRTSDIDIVKSANAVVVGSGAAPPVLRALSRAGVKYFTESGPGYFRVGNRVSPYNLLVHLRHLAGTLKKLTTAPANYFNWGKESDFPGSRPAHTIAARFSGFRTSLWKYEDGKYVNTNSYAAAGDQFKPATVIVVRVQEGVASYRDPAGNPVPVTLYRGQGKMLMFHGGQVVAGTWKKSGDGRVGFSTAAGSLTVPPGKVWLELVPVDARGGKVTFHK